MAADDVPLPLSGAMRSTTGWKARDGNDFRARNVYSAAAGPPWAGTDPLLGLGLMSRSARGWASAFDRDV
jgi:hypothetical protein